MDLPKKGEQVECPGRPYVDVRNGDVCRCFNQRDRSNYFVGQSEIMVQKKPLERL
ncbi:hypothetical protein OKN36_16600 [Furfurilactobacillus sp. OKN36]